MAFATVADLEARWRPLTTEEESRASVLLDDAAVYLSALVTVDPTDEEQAAVLKTVSCSMVQRVMSADVDTYGLSQTSMTAGSYTLGSTIQLLDEDGTVVFSTFVYIEGDIELPTTLSGTYTIQLIRGNQTFEGEITL